MEDVRRCIYIYVSDVIQFKAVWLKIYIKVLNVYFTKCVFLEHLF